ncbi:MAG: Mrp/NBP35 family ATP-binding protein [Planctomycetota bacterium]|jgi:ATP-binding protein involved in chromosome partitioning
MADENVPTKEQIVDALRVIIDPDLGRDIVSLGFIKDVRIVGGDVGVTIELTTPACPLRKKFEEQARNAILSIPEVKNAEITMTAKVRPTPSEQKKKMLPDVLNVVPVASGKGGVGKSTVAVNLAIALARTGAKVGLADLDVYGPSVPRLMGAKRAPIVKGDKLIPPVEHGVKVVSMDFFTPPGKAVLWRGPLLHKAVEQFLGSVIWKDLDYLIADLPPGTGDVQLSLCQLIPITGAVVVSTPQDVALKVAEKAMMMFGQMGAPILGLVENMSGYVCSKCGRREEIFGSGGARRYCEKKDVPFLGEIPLATDIRKTSDAGDPIVVSDPGCPSAQAFVMIAKNLAAQISIRTVKDEPLSTNV